MTPGTDWLPPWLRGAWEVPGVTDVVVNAPDALWIDRGLGLERWESPERGLTALDIRETAVRLASLAGRRLDDASPLVDARMPDGSRLHAVLPPIADGCALISLRAVRSHALSMSDLVLAGTVAESLAAVLEELVAARASVLVTGATGAGKTTLLATLLSLVPATERVVVVEEAGEVNPNHPHVVRLVERRANVDGAGAVGLAQLVREALRMRPDRIVLGECRGAEVREVMLALNTGHRGGFATMHANGLADVPARLVGLAALADMSERAASLHAASAFDVVLHVERTGGLRRVAQMGVLALKDGAVAVESAIQVDSAGLATDGPARARLDALLEGAA